MNKPRNVVRNGDGSGVHPLGSDHPQPGAQVIVVRNPGDLAVLDLEEGTDAQVVLLSGGGREAFVGLKIFTTNVEFGGGAAGVWTGEDDEVLHLLAVRTVHAAEESAEGGDADLDAAFVDLVDNIGMQECEQRLTVAGVESLVILLDERVHGFR